MFFKIFFTKQKDISVVCTTLFGMSYCIPLNDYILYFISDTDEEIQSKKLRMGDDSDESDNEKEDKSLMEASGMNYEFYS